MLLLSSIFPTTFMNKLLLLTTSFLLGLPVLTLAQSPWEIIQDQFQQADDFFNARGYSLSQELSQGQLSENAHENITVNLTSGNVYAIVAFCDLDCEDLNLELYDEQNNLVDYDRETDDKPIVLVQPEETSQFLLKITMASCNRAACEYGLGIYGRKAE